MPQLFLQKIDEPVIIAKVSHPIPFRTRPLNPFTPMVLCLKTRESRSSPVLLSSVSLNHYSIFLNPFMSPAPSRRFFLYLGRDVVISHRMTSNCARRLHFYCHPLHSALRSFLLSFLALCGASAHQGISSLKRRTFVHKRFCSIIIRRCLDFCFAKKA